MGNGSRGRIRQMTPDDARLAADMVDEKTGGKVQIK
jgi:hypothetical protein